MKQIYRNSERFSVETQNLASLRVMLLMLLLLISMTGCNRRYVVVNGDETVQVKKGELDRLYSDNENLLKALEQCRAR